MSCARSAYLCQTCHLWSSKAVFFDPKSCILLTKIALTKKKMDQCLLQFLHTGRIFLMDNWLNNDFVMSGVFDEPMNIPKLPTWDACRILYRREFCWNSKQLWFFRNSWQLCAWLPFVCVWYKITVVPTLCSFGILKYNRLESVNVLGVWMGTL